MEQAWTVPEHAGDGELKRLSVASARPRRLRAWLNELPLGRPLESAPRLLRLLDELARLRLEPRRRLELLELARPTARQAAYALERHYLNLPLLPPERGMQAASLARALFERLAQGYESVALAVLAGGRARPARQVAAVTLQRAVDALSHRLFLHCLLYTQPEPGLWRRLHRLYAVAEQDALEGITVADPELPGQEGSVHIAYARLLLTVSAQPNQLRQPALMALYRAAAHWARWLPLFSDTGEALFAVDLDGDRPPYLSPDGNPLADRRFFDTRPLAAALAEDASPARPAPLSDLLQQHLRWVWLGPRRRRVAREPASGELSLCLGMSGVHDRLTGQVEPQRPYRASLLDQCDNGYRLEWRGDAPCELRAGGLTAVSGGRDGAWRVAEIRWVRAADGCAQFGIALLPDSVRPVRVSTGAGAGAPALLLPAPTASDSDTLLLPTQGYRSGARVTLWDRDTRNARLGLRVGGSPDVVHYTLREALPV